MYYVLGLFTHGLGFMTQSMKPWRTRTTYLPVCLKWMASPSASCSGGARYARAANGRCGNRYSNSWALYAHASLLRRLSKAAPSCDLRGVGHSGSTAQPCWEAILHTSVLECRSLLRLWIEAKLERKAVQEHRTSKCALYKTHVIMQTKSLPAIGGYTFIDC